MRIQRLSLQGRAVYVALDSEDQPKAAADSLEHLLAGRSLRDQELLEGLASDQARLLPPCRPSKIVCVGLNYRRHAEELKKPLPPYPLIFLKPSTAVIASGQPILLPPSSEEVHHEGELAVVIRHPVRNVPEDRAHEAILGYTLMNDVTARDIQRREGKYTHCKGFDTFAPLGPTICSGLDPDELSIGVRVNGARRQASGCSDMIFKVPQLIAFVSSIMTLLPGDVISTGTPSGVGPIQAGDLVRVAIDEIGELINPVKDDAAGRHVGVRGGLPTGGPG